MTTLVQAFNAPVDPEMLRAPLSDMQWNKLSAYLLPLSLTESRIIYKRGSHEKSLYFLESGRIAIHYENSQGKLRISLIDAGNFFGEASFLGKQNRLATAQVAAAGKCWVLTTLKFTEMVNRSPELALAIQQQAAYVLAQRIANRTRRIAIS